MLITKVERLRGSNRLSSVVNRTKKTTKDAIRTTIPAAQPQPINEKLYLY
ncbi:MAG: hypothetical protein AB1546_06280 [bacterium]